MNQIHTVVVSSNRRKEVQKSENCRVAKGAVSHGNGLFQKETRRMSVSLTRGKWGKRGSYLRKWKL